MMKPIVLISGANGMVAKSLALTLYSEYTVRFLTRVVKSANEFKWDTSTNYIDPHALQGVNHIIHLAGASIADQRWTQRRKQDIYSSRVDGAKLIFHELVANGQKIDSFISASAIGYYGSETTSQILTEESDNGKDFLADVCNAWEDVAHSFKSENVAQRTSILRFGIVLGPNKGALKKMVPPIKLGVGAAVGSGTQWMPWIHIDDISEMVKFLITNEISGTFNAVAPEHITNNEFTQKLGDVLKRKIAMPNIPPLFFKLIFGEMAVILLTGSRVSSKKIQNLGYEFKYANLHDALRHILAKKTK